MISSPARAAPPPAATSLTSTLPASIFSTTAANCFSAALLAATTAGLPSA